MKKTLYLLLIGLVTFAGFTMLSCDHNNGTEPETPIVDPDPEPEASILGLWYLENATQYVGENSNPVNMTPMYGENFSLNFLEDGTLIASQAGNQATMEWTLDGENLAFIQAPGMDPVMYIVRSLSLDKLVIENGTGTDYVTVMELIREPIDYSK